MPFSVSNARHFRGELRVPGDKSISHRALILGAIAEGEQIVDGLAKSADIETTARCLRALGVTITESEGGRVNVRGGGVVTGATLDAGNSGTTARLLCGLVAGLGASCTIDGDVSLRARPMRRVTNPLARMGANIDTNENGGLPIHIKAAPLRGIRYELPVASAQVKSALLIAGLFASGETTVVEPVPTRDHTERMLTAMGTEVRRHGGAVSIQGGQRPRGVHIIVPGDFSSAAFFIAAAAGVPGSRVTVCGCGVNPTRTGMLDIITEMGCRVETVNERDAFANAGGEPVADVVIRESSLRAITIDDPVRIAAVIDEIPVLAVLATRAAGTTMIRSAGELRVKESDRIKATAENLRILGADVEEFDDGLAVAGPVQLRGGNVSSFGDHRMAMAMAVAGLFGEGETVIDDATAVDISYPGFFDDLKTLSD